MLLAGIIFTASPGGVSAQANSPPNFVPQGATFYVYSYTPGGAEFWTPQTAIDKDGDTLTYSLSGTDSSSFSIDSSTVQLSQASGANLDADTKNTYYITIVATDTSNDTGTKTVTVEVRKYEQGLGIWCGTVDAGASNPDVQFKGYWEEHSNQTVHTGDPFGELMPRKVVSFGGSDFDVVFVAEDKDADKLQFHLLNHTSQTQRDFLSADGLRVRVHDGSYKLLPLTSVYWHDASPMDTTGDRYEWSDKGIEWRSGNAYFVAIVPLIPQFADTTGTRDVRQNTPVGTYFGEPATVIDFGGRGVTYSLDDTSNPGHDAGPFIIHSTDGRLSVNHADLSKNAGSAFTFDVVATDAEKRTGSTTITVNVLNCADIWCATLTAGAVGTSGATGYEKTGEGKLLPSAHFSLDGVARTVTLLAHFRAPTPGQDEELISTLFRGPPTLGRRPSKGTA